MKFNDADFFDLLDHLKIAMAYEAMKTNLRFVAVQNLTDGVQSISASVSLVEGELTFDLKMTNNKGEVIFATEI